MKGASQERHLQKDPARTEGDRVTTRSKRKAPEAERGQQVI